MTDTTVPGFTRPDQITTTSLVGQRGKIEAALLVVFSAVYAPATDLTYLYGRHSTFVDVPPFAQEWRPKSILNVTTAFPVDIVAGFDNFVGYPPVEVFAQPQRSFLIAALQSYAAYVPSTDIFYPQFRRKPTFVDVDPFPQAFGHYPRNLEIKPAPAGDLTTQLRKVPWFDPPPLFPVEQPTAYGLLLNPGLGPLPGPTPPAAAPYWPQPSAITNLPVRGAWTLPGSTQAIWVIASGCYVMSADLSLKLVGFLYTDAGAVCIRDNGAGGNVVIVDGTYGYLYTFSAAGGTVGQFQVITDANFPGATRVVFIDGWWVFSQPNSQQFFTPISTYSTAFNGTNFALIDGATDNLVTMYENKEELWLVGERHTEIWFDAGGTYFAFQRLVSTMLQVGCSAAASIARFNAEGEDGLVWLALSERGQNVVVRTQGFQAVVISTPAINHAFASYAIVSDAIGYTYQEDGHEFYVLTFPSAVNEYGGSGATWVYDGTTDQWHERLAYEPYSNTWNRHRSNCFLNFQNMRLVGDYQNGSIYQMTRQAYTDAGWPLVSWRRAPHIWDGGARERVFMAFLQLDFRPGVGNSSVVGTDPQAILQISRDGGTTFGQQMKRSMGKIGQFLNRVIWRRLSFSRDAVIDVKVYDPVNRDIVGATLRKGEFDG